MCLCDFTEQNSTHITDNKYLGITKSISQLEGLFYPDNLITCMRTSNQNQKSRVKNSGTSETATMWLTLTVVLKQNKLSL